MKKTIIFFIDIYQKLISPSIKTLLGFNRICRYNLTCSEYAKRVILKYGIAKGGKLALLRIISCRP